MSQDQAVTPSFPFVDPGTVNLPKPSVLSHGVGVVAPPPQGWLLHPSWPSIWSDFCSNRTLKWARLQQAAHHTEQPNAAAELEGRHHRESLSSQQGTEVRAGGWRENFSKTFQTPEPAQALQAPQLAGRQVTAIFTDTGPQGPL